MHILSMILLWVGGINWGLIGIGGFMSKDWNIVHKLLSFSPTVEWIVYILVGLAAIYEIVGHKKACTNCMGNKMGGNNM